jgi:hypothetical protein
MTHQDFLQWIDKEIDIAYWAEGIKISDNPNFYRGMKTAFISAKEKFLTIEYPQPTETENNFTNGLE